MKTCAIPIERWDGCYDESWRDLIVPEAFAHPAKMSRGLIARIFDHLFAIWAIQAGDRCCPQCGFVVEPEHYGWNSSTTSAAVRAACLPSKVHPDTPEPEVLQHQLWSQDVTDRQDLPAPLDASNEGVRNVRAGVQAEECGDSLLPKVVREYVDGSQPSELQGRADDQRERVCSHPEPGASACPCGSLRVRASAGDGATPGPAAAAERGRASRQRGQDGQSDREPGSAHEAPPRPTASAASESQPDAADVSVLCEQVADVAPCPGCGGPIRLPSLIADCFGGIGTTCIEAASRGLRSVACELEPKFVALAQQNFALHERDWTAMDRPLPKIVQGDSRQLRQHVGSVLAECVLSSPPYARSDQDYEHGVKRIDWTKGTRAGLKTDRCSGPEASYGDSDGQLGAMPEGDVSAIISSPPYAEIASGSGGLNTKPPKHEGQQAGRSASAASQDTDSRYGESDGQLARMSLGDVDVIVSSPPYEECDTRPTAMGAGKPTRADGDGAGRNKGDYHYGDSEGQLGTLRGGTVAAVVSSPPYSESLTPGNRDNSSEHRQDLASAAGHGRIGGGQLAHANRYSFDENNLGNLPAGAVDSVVSSPPYPQPYEGGGGINVTGYTGDKPGGVPDSVGKRTYQGRGEDREDRAEGNLETLALGTVADAVVSSPPYTGDVAPHRNGIDCTKFAPGVKTGGPNSQARSQGYGGAEGQLGGLRSDETFWSAAKQIVEESYAILKPGGVAVWVVKMFVRDKALVDFPGDWRKLCEHVGFDTFLEVHASLVHEEVRSHLFDGEVTKRRERKSFFRRLAEKKGSPRIDFETVYFMVKR